MRGRILSVAVFLLMGCSSGGDEPAPAGSTGQTASSTSTYTTASGGNGSSGGTGQGGDGGSGQGGGGDGGSGQGGGSGAVWGPSECPETPPGVDVGFDVGDQLADIVVKTCEGEDVSLTELCGADGLFIFAAHGWCPLCKSVSGQQEAIHDSFAGKNLASVNIVVETGLSKPPDGDYCKLWRDQHGHEDVLTLYDPTGAVLALWPGGSSSLSAYVDHNRLIVSKLVHDGNVETIKGEIQKALDQ